MESKVGIPSALGCLIYIGRHHGLHLTAEQLTRTNLLTGEELSSAGALKSAQSVGLVAKAVALKWESLAKIKKALPALVRLTNGSYLVLQRVDIESPVPQVVLIDPKTNSDMTLTLDRLRIPRRSGQAKSF